MVRFFIILLPLFGTRDVAARTAPVLIDSVIPADAVCTDTNCVKYIAVNVHYLLKTDGSGNFTETGDGYPEGDSAHQAGVTGFMRARLLVDGANRVNSKAVKNWRSPEGVGVVSKRFRYVLKGVYFHRDDTAFNASSLLYPDFTLVTKKYGVHTDKEVNVFMTHETQPIGTSGVVCCELDSAMYSQMGFLTIFMRDWEVWYKKKWDDGAWHTLNHEFGHLMGLQHDWQAQFPDLLPYPINPPKNDQGCANYDATAGAWCNDWGHISNNSMGASSYDRTLTPDQIAFIHLHLETYLKGYVEYCVCAHPPRTGFFKRLGRLFSSRRTRKADTPTR